MKIETQKLNIPDSEKITAVELAANNFFDMADKINPYIESEGKKRETYSSIGSEVAQGNYDKAQRIAEVNILWDDNTRNAIFEVNRLEQERTGTNPMTIEDAQKAISGYARAFENMSKENGGTQQDLESAMDIDNIVADISEPGIQVIDNALEYIEGVLQSKCNISESILKSISMTSEDKALFLKDWQEKRAIRDALYAEKQRRIEQSKQTQETNETLNKERNSVARNLENLYANAGVPENIPSRQEFLIRVQHMSEVELSFLESSLKKAAVEFARTRDVKNLDGQLLDLSSKSFKLDDVKKEQQENDAQKIEEIRAKLDPEKFAKEEKSKNGKKYEEIFKTINLEQTLSDGKNAYTAQKGAVVILESLKNIYGNDEQAGLRINALVEDFRSTLSDAKESRPDTPLETLETYAINQVFKKLSEAELSAIDRVLDSNYQKMGNSGQRMISSRMPFGDFIKLVADIKS